MKLSKISFPLVHKRSTLPTLCVLFAIVGSVPILMVMWVAACSQFTRVEGTNETALYNVYICIRAIFALTLLVSVAVYDTRRASAALLPAVFLGLISTLLRLLVAMTSYLNKKSLANAISVHPNYSQNYIDLASAALLFITAVVLTIYLVGLFKTSFPVILFTVVTLIFELYSVISYSITYQPDNFTVISRFYAVPICLGVTLFCISSKTKAQLEGKVKKEKYVPRRMKA